MAHWIAICRGWFESAADLNVANKGGFVRGTNQA